MNARPLLLSLLLPATLLAAEPGTLTPPDSLVLDGVPPIPVEIAAQVGRYTESRAAAFLDWQPGKPEMLILTRFGDTNQVHLVAQPGGARTQLTFFDDRINEASFDPQAGAFFVFSKSAGGNEFNQNYRYDFATGEVALLTDGKSRNSAPTWSTDGKRVAYTSTRRNGADTDIYLESPNDPKSDRLLAEVKGGGWNVFDWSPDDSRLLVLERISINEAYLWLFDTKTGARTELTPRPAEGAEKIAYAEPLFAKDGKGIFVTTDRESEFLRLTYIDLATKEHTYLVPEAKWDVDDWDLSADGQRIAYTLNENGTSTLHLISVAMRDGKMAATALPDPGLRPAHFRLDYFRSEVAPETGPARLQRERRALALRRLHLVARGENGRDSLDDERDRRHPGRAFRRTKAHPLEIFRWPRDHRLSLPARREKIPGAATGDREHPRRSGISGPPRFCRAQQLHLQRTRLRDDFA